MAGRTDADMLQPIVFFGLLLTGGSRSIDYNGVNNEIYAIAAFPQITVPFLRAEVCLRTTTHTVDTHPNPLGYQQWPQCDHQTLPPRKRHMQTHRPILLALLTLLSPSLFAAELPWLAKEIDVKTHNFAAQKQLPDLATPYVSTSPQDLDDGLQVGTLDLPGTDKAVQTLIADDKAGKYSNLDSILIWKDGKLLFEMYSRRGRVDGPHYAMSVTKTMTSVVLARAMQLGFLNMQDLDKPIVSFMPKLDLSKVKPGVDTITLRDALFMKSGLRFVDKSVAFKLGAEYKRQAYFQKLFEATESITPESKQYKYSGIDPSMIMMIVDIEVPGSVQDFIAKEVATTTGAIYNWDDQGCGIPKCGAGSNFTSRSLMKFGVTVIQGGKFNGEQLLSAEYVKTIMSKKPTEGYYYFFHNRLKTVKGQKVRFISGVGAGGQYMATFPELNIVAVATAHNKGQIGLPLQAFLEHLIPLFVK